VIAWDELVGHDQTQLVDFKFQDFAEVDVAVDVLLEDEIAGGVDVVVPVRERGFEALVGVFVLCFAEVTRVHVILGTVHFEETLDAALVDLQLPVLFE